MAPTHASASTIGPKLPTPSVAMTFEAPATACTEIHVASESELRALLLPARLAASDSVTDVRVDKIDAASGCKLRVEVFRPSTDSTATDVFDIATAVDAKIALAAPRNTQLRGAADATSLMLERMTLQVAQTYYDVVLHANALDVAKPVSSALSLHGRKCSPHLQNAALVQRHVLPLDVDAGALTVTTSNDVAASMGHELDCAVWLDVTARAPLLRADDVDDALSYVRAFDAKLDETFAPNASVRVFASIELHAPTSAAVASPSSAVMAMAAADSELSAQLPSNAPTKALTMSVLAGLVALVAMLVAVALAKTRHDKKCVERHRMASQAAQIRRVSIRMASPKRNAMGEEVEEEKHNDSDDDSNAYGETDDLL